MVLIDFFNKTMPWRGDKKQPGACREDQYDQDHDDHENQEGQDNQDAQEVE